MTAPMHPDPPGASTELAARRIAEDVQDIEAGGIHPKTLHGYAELFAEGMRQGTFSGAREP